jgi:hypothetical protein
VGNESRDAPLSALEVVSMRTRSVLGRLILATCLLAGSAWPAWSQDPDDQGCIACHADRAAGFNPAHGFAASACVACHDGDAAASDREDAHSGLIAFPGGLADAERACGGCHADRVDGIRDNLMHTGRGMVRVTRQVIDGSAGDEATQNLQSLGDSVADSMLRKQCAGCHLGQAREAHAIEVTSARGGGCAACHVNDYPETGHVALSATVSDARCFGCHSRSGRISLSFAGLAEIDPPADDEDRLRLADGRHVARMQADAHYLAGMGCIDCHTSLGMMGAAASHAGQREAVDIGCADCHANAAPRLALADWPADLPGAKRRIPFATNPATRFLATQKHGTPLWHIELRADGAWLHTKSSGKLLKIPQASTTAHAGNGEHQRLECSSCHSQWAPQCFGCHMAYDPAGEQFDHSERQNTPGRWSDERWHVDNALPVLGVTAGGRIGAFVPGMIMTIAHPSWEEERFLRRFAPLSPHTTGRSRSCLSCHRSSRAVGLGEGELVESTGRFVFEPRYERLADGLPADAWTSLENDSLEEHDVYENRPFTSDELYRVLRAPLSNQDAAAN